MIEKGLAGSFWPSARQKLLLQTVLLDEGQAADAWARLRRILDIDALEPGSYALMPLLYRQLNRLGVEGPVSSRLKGIYRRTWYLNHMQLKRAQRVLDLLHEADVDPIVVNGWELAIWHYGDLALRAVERLDILIRQDDVARTLEALCGVGWIAEFAVSPRILRSRHRVRLVNADGDEILVRWRLFHEFVLPESNIADLWQASFNFDLGDVPVRALGAADELLNVCLSGARPRFSPSIRWIADAAFVQASETDLDWDRLVRQAVGLRATLRLRDALLYLSGTVAMSVPAAVLDQCNRIRPRREIFAYRVAASHRGIIGLPPETITRFLVATAGDPVPGTVLQLPVFLRDEWGLERVSEVPGKAIEKIVARVATGWQALHPVLRLKSRFARPIGRAMSRVVNR